MIENEKYKVYHSSEFPPLVDDDKDARDPEPKKVIPPKKYPLWEIALSGIFHHIAKLFVG